jgi:hypothetical protein
MKQEVTDQGLFKLTEVYNPVIFETSSRESLAVMMRDSGYELIYNGEFLELKENKLKCNIEPENNSTSGAIKVLVEALKRDEGYKMSWLANIAMAFQDEFQEWKDHLKVELPFHLDIHRISNNAAERFLDALLMASEEKAGGTESLDELNDDGIRRPQEEVEKELETTNAPSSQLLVKASNLYVGMIVYRSNDFLCYDVGKHWEPKRMETVTDQMVSYENLIDSAVVEGTIYYKYLGDGIFEELVRTKDVSEELDKTIGDVEHYTNNYVKVKESTPNFIKEHPMTPEEAFETQPTVGYVQTGPNLKFKEILLDTQLRSICIGAYYVGLDGADGIKNYELSLEFSDKIGKSLGELDDVRFIPALIAKVQEYYGFTERQFNNVVEYITENVRKFLVELPKEDHGSYVSVERLYEGNFYYTRNGQLFRAGGISPIPLYSEDKELGDSKRISFIELEESFAEHEIRYQFVEGEFVKSEKSATREAEEKKQDDSPEEFPEWFKLIDFNNINKLNELNELIRKLYPDNKYDYPNSTPEVNPCANCSEYIKSQRLGTTLICNCTIPYMNNPIYIGSNSGYSTGSSSIDIGRPAGSSSISFIYNGPTAK